MSSNVTIKWTLSFRKCFINGFIIVSPRCVLSFGVLCGGLLNRSRRRVTNVWFCKKKEKKEKNVSVSIGQAKLW